MAALGVTVAGKRKLAKEVSSWLSAVCGFHFLSESFLDSNACSC
jgi:hypothetical protein